MQLIKDLEKIKKPYKSAVITIGNFDGVHLGHQALFHTVIEKADAINGTSVAVTFDQHPLRVLKKNGDLPLITLNEQKIELIEKTGIDVLICIPFTIEFAGITALAFIKDLLIQKIGMKAIVIGNDYTFGKNREGNIHFLKQNAKELNFEVIVTGWIQTSGFVSERVSSTRIRDMVMAGNVEDAQKLLGRYYQIRGTVATGRDRGGKLLGFPTANINLQDELCPQQGVYAVTVECLDELHRGVANIGYSPTFDDHLFTVEVHIFDFNQNIYGEKIRVNFIKRIRDEKKFSNVSELAEQIHKDVAQAHDILSS